MVTIDDVLALEKKHRNQDKWFIFNDVVRNDNGFELAVQIKSFGFYNQILRVNGSDINYASGHTINKVKPMHEHLRKAINLQ